MTVFERVASYAAGNLDEDAMVDVEQRLFADPEYAAAAAWLVELTDALRDVARRGPIVPILTPAELGALARSHNVLECRSHEGTVVATITPEREFVAARLPIDLHDARHIDVAIGPDGAAPHFVTRDAPFDPDAQEIVVLCRAHIARLAGRIRIVVSDERKRTRGEYVLDTT